MIFNSHSSMSTNKTVDSIKTTLKGKHLQVHKLDFEVFEKDDVMKIIPHAEEVDGIITLPITNVKIKQKNNKTVLDIESHPRRIDIGGPYILVILCLVMFFAGLLIGLYGGTEYSKVSLIMTVLPLTIFSIFWIRMELGYFDYVRKIKSWIRKEISL